MTNQYKINSVELEDFLIKYLIKCDEIVKTSTNDNQERTISLYPNEYKIDCVFNYFYIPRLNVHLGGDSNEIFKDVKNCEFYLKLFNLCSNISKTFNKEIELELIDGTHAIISSHVWKNGTQYTHRTQFYACNQPSYFKITINFDSTSFKEHVGHFEVYNLALNSCRHSDIKVKFQGYELRPFNVS